MLRRLKIDPEFQSKIPPLTFEELNLLEANILEEGRIISPLIVWNGLIVDGHNRFAILKNHPEIEYTVLEKEFANRYEAIVWICKNQLGRRNLTPQQFKYLIGQRYEAEKQAHGGERKATDKICPLTSSHQTRASIAQEAKVSEGFVQNAAGYAKGVDAAEDAVPGTRAKILSGEIKPTAAELAAVSRAAPEERPALVEEICKPKKRAKSKNGEMKAPEAEAPEASKQTELPPEASPESHSKPTAPASVKIDNQQLREIAASRYHAKRLATGSDMLCEIEAAADNMKQRWEQTFKHYPDILTAPDNRAAVAKIAQSLMEYLKEVEERTL